MNAEIFIARRIGRGSASGPGRGMVVRIAVATVAVSIAVMIVTVAVIAGFRSEITEKIVGFHSLAGRVQKTGLMKTDEATRGIVVKGIGVEDGMGFFEGALVSGSLPRVGDSVRHKDILISAGMARELQLAVDDRVEVLFVGSSAGFEDLEAPRRDRFRVSGIYESGMEEMDRVIALTDAANVERVGGRAPLMVGTPESDYPQLFDWLATHNVNAAVIITIMIVVALISMISALLIIVLERIRTIGILKTLGMSGGALRRVFLLRAAGILLWGLLIGNVVGTGLAALQKLTGAVKLPSDGYFISAVPIALDAWWIVALNAGTVGVILAVLILPTGIIGRITPEKTVRYQ